MSGGLLCGTSWARAITGTSVALQPSVDLKLEHAAPSPC
jgi:hypothetical protein